MNRGGITLWGFVGTIVLTTILAGCQALGLTRINIPFMLGTMVTLASGASAEVLVIGNANEEGAQALAGLRSGQTLIDLTRGGVRRVTAGAAAA